MHRPNAGLLCGVAAYGLWGLMPLYFRALGRVHPAELLAHRIVWSVVFLAGLLTLLGRWRQVTSALARPRLRLLLLAGTGLIAANWFAFIYGVWIGQVVQNSLGYFINPLLNILLGVAVFRERLRRAQWAALLLAAGGLVYLMAALGEVPWIAFFLAGSFALYGLIRKMAPVEALAGLTAETLLLLPVAFAFLVGWHWRELAAFGRHGWQVDTLLLTSGVVTAVPLLCFGAAARALPLSTLGFLQYLAPTIQLLIAVGWLGEPFRPAQQVGFGLIWAALAIVSADALLARRRRRPAAEADRRASRLVAAAPGDAVRPCR